MKLGALGEFALLDRLGVERADLPENWVGPGDDCAVLPHPGGDLVVTTDLLLEGVHFRRATTPPRELGRKALAVNLSDLAAMGAEPLAFTVAAAFPAELDVAWIEALYDGLSEEGARYRCPAVGGDTSAGPAVLLAVTALGRAGAGRAVLRSGARPGQDLYLSGTTGESAAGFGLLEAGHAPGPDTGEAFRRHLTPEPRLALGAALARGLAGAMIDVSDGVAQDAGHIARRSSVGVEIEAGRVVLSGALRAAARILGADPLRLALAGGEDYELLFTADPGARTALAALAASLGLPLTRIGRIGEAGAGGPAVTVRGPAGEFLDFASGGFDHFRRAGP